MRIHELVSLAAVAASFPKPKREAIRVFNNAARDIGSALSRHQPIQRRMQTVLVPAAFAAMTGHDLSTLGRADARSLTDLCDAERHPKAKMFLSAVRAILSKTRSSKTRSSQQQFASDAREYLTGIYTHLAAREFGAPNIFTLSDGLVERLVETDCGSVSVDTVRPPFPGFYVEMPPGTLEIFNALTGWHHVSLVGISEATRDGARVMYGTFFGEPQSGATALNDTVERGTSNRPTEVQAGKIRAFMENAGDDHVQSVYMPMVDKATEETLSPAFIDEHEMCVSSPFVRWRGIQYDNYEGGGLLYQVLANFCLYLSSPNADIQPAGGRHETWAEALEHADACRTSPHLKRPPAERRFTLWDAGRNAKALRASPTDVVVRGHWRRQAHGPNWTLRKVIWVEPHVRLPTGDVPPGHDYVVENDEA